MSIKPHLHVLLAAALLVPAASQAITIGYYGSSKEDWGFVGNNYLSQARQFLVDEGHTLVSTSVMDGAFLSGVDAVYVGLLSSAPSVTEISALQNFVDVQGGFLFIQTDWTSALWTAPANAILANWGIAHDGSYSNDSGHTTVGTSEWVTTPNAVAGFIGSQHSVVTSAPSDFEVLGVDDLGRTILGVFDAGAGRSSDVLISTDINFWDDSAGWTNASNRNLWENIWQAASDQTGGGGGRAVPAPATLGLLGAGLMGLAVLRRQQQAT